MWNLSPLNTSPHSFHPSLHKGKALREKEKGDWKKLTLEEKKQLYRASFCQTFVEMDAPTGEWKTVTGCTLFFISVALWVFMGMKLFVYPKELPPTFSEERQQAQMQRMIDISVNPVEGFASHWDYEKNDWKK
uniref:Cytochrome c oxidase subunit 4 n=1 Tax=Cuerna arida TaxID=1464854 RepID=A0A1B6F1K2_9HEMI